jgi:hypothetical protein
LKATLRDLAGYGGGFDAGRFIQLDQAGQRQRTLSELGQQASLGDLQGAERTAWAGGQTDIAAQLRGMNQQDHERLVQDTASFALSADTPEKWQAMGQQFAQAHPGFDIPPFQARQALIDRAVPVAEQLKMRQAQSNADREYALQQQKLAQGGDGSGQFFGTPLPYQGPDGTVGYALPSKAGGVKALELPDGSKFLGPYDKSLATSQGKIDAQKPEKAAKAYNLLQSADQQWTAVQDQIETAKKQIDKGILPNTGFFGTLFSGVGGTTQYDLNQTLDMIKANIGFDKLQEMRANSPTGGALGNVSDFEDKLLQAVRGSLQQGQTGAQLKEHLDTISTLIDGLRKDRQAAYQRDFGDVSGGGGGGEAAGGGWSIEPVQ